MGILQELTVAPASAVAFRLCGVAWDIGILARESGAMRPPAYSLLRMQPTQRLWASFVAALNADSAGS